MGGGSAKKKMSKERGRQWPGSLRATLRRAYVRAQRVCLVCVFGIVHGVALWHVSFFSGSWLQIPSRGGQRRC